MMRLGGKQLWSTVLCAIGLALCVGAPAAQAAFDDPIFVYKPEPPKLGPNEPPPPPIPPPSNNFEDACGLAIDGVGNFYISDYYHHAVDLFSSGAGYIEQLLKEVEQPSLETEPLGGPCGLALDPFGSLYVNNFHRNVVRFPTSPAQQPGTVITGAPVDSAHPTGVAADSVTGTVYVDNRTHVSVFDTVGNELGQIGSGTLLDGYGIARSEFPATAGRLYVPDAASETVKVYSSTIGSTVPVATIDGSGTPNGHFVSLRNAAVAVDNETGEVYVADNLQPVNSERAETVIYVFTSAGVYKGRLKYAVENGLPPGLAVDNSGGITQSRVYVTSGNTEKSAVYAYRPHSATNNAVGLLQDPAPLGGGGVGTPDSGAFAAAPASVASAPGAGDASSAPTAVSGTPPAVKHPSHRAQRKAKNHRRAKHRRHARKAAR